MQAIWLQDSCMEIARMSLKKRLEDEILPDDTRVLEQIDKILLEGELRQIPLTEKLLIRKELFYSVRKLDILQELLDDPDITEIMVNGPDSIFYEKNGRIYNWNKKFTSGEKLMDVIQQIVGNCNRVVNESSPIVDARLENGDRVNVVVSPAALNGPILTIRRFPLRPIDMEQLLEREALTQDAADFLRWMVEEKQSIVVGGGTSTGKTTFLNALSAYIPSQERIITIEGTAELQLQNIQNLVRLEAKQANLEGGVSVTIRDLIHSEL